jgi:RimJ/RimL family protein N-acetyltransferase
MQIERYTDPVTYCLLVSGWLGERHWQHSFLHMLTCNMTQCSLSRSDGRLYLAKDGGKIVGAAIIAAALPKRPLLISDLSLRAIQALVEAVRHEGIELTDVIGPVAQSELFAKAWTINFRRRFLLGTFSLTTVPDTPEVRGELFPAGERDIGVLESWLNAFITERNLNESTELLREEITDRVSKVTPYYWVWVVEGEVVSMCSVANYRQLARIGAVYTPLEFRCNGYASGIVSAVARKQFSSNVLEMFLSTDLANQKAIAVYEQIGFKLLAKQAHYDLI